jgi:hypothetical protein
VHRDHAGAVVSVRLARCAKWKWIPTRASSRSYDIRRRTRAFSNSMAVSNRRWRCSIQSGAPCGSAA